MPRVTTIGKNAFYQCELTQVSVGSGLQTIGESAFFKNTNLARFIVPTSDATNNLRSIGKSAFYGLWMLSFPFVHCPRLETIGDHAFEFTSHGEHEGRLTLPPSVKYIGEAAFMANQGLQVVYIPDDAKVTVLKKHAFAGCCFVNSFRRI